MSKYHTRNGTPWEKEELEHLVQESKLPNVRVAHNKNGFFVSPQKQRIVKAEDAGNVGKRSQPGICARVRQWSEKNPQATPKDAIEHFKNDNPITVRIQHHKGQE